jgi:hypothetical protein
MPLASRGEGGPRSPPFNRSRTLGGGERTLAIKHQSSHVGYAQGAPAYALGDGAEPGPARGLAVQPCCPVGWEPRRAVLRGQERRAALPRRRRVLVSCGRAVRQQSDARAGVPSPSACRRSCCLHRCLRKGGSAGRGPAASFRRPAFLVGASALVGHGPVLGAWARPRRAVPSRHTGAWQQRQAAAGWLGRTYALARQARSS